MVMQSETLISPATAIDVQVPPRDAQIAVINNSPTICPPPLPPQMAANSLSQLLGLHFYAAFLTIVVDMMVFAGDVASLGLLLPVAIGAAGILGYIVYLIQRRFYGDDHQAALIKGLAIALLTAIPAPLAPLITVPSGIIGVVSMVRRKRG